MSNTSVSNFVDLGVAIALVVFVLFNLSRLWWSRCEWLRNCWSATKINALVFVVVAIVYYGCLYQPYCTPIADAAFAAYWFVTLTIMCVAIGLITTGYPKLKPWLDRLRLE